MASNKSSKSGNVHKKKKKPTDERSTIKTGYRIGALILVVVIIVSLLTMYSF